MLLCVRASSALVAMPRLLTCLLRAASRQMSCSHAWSVQVIRKADLVRKNMVQSVRNERNILAQANNPFVVRCLATLDLLQNRRQKAAWLSAAAEVPAGRQMLGC